MQRVAAIQMCSTHDVDENLQNVARQIEQAYENKASLIILPEMFCIMGLSEKDKVAAKETYGSGKIQDFLANIARKTGTWIVAGTLPLECDDPDKVYAASLLYDEQGVVVARYDKIHLFDVELSGGDVYKESDTTKPGNKGVVVDTPVGKLGLGVCYDVRFPEMFRYLAKQGAEIIALPSAFTARTGQAHWELLTRSRAVDNFSYVIGAAQGGLHTSGRKTYGNSLIVDPWGTVIARNQGVQPAIIYADIDHLSQREIRKSIPSLEDEQCFFEISTRAAQSTN
jgi:deaminated glutathione amidase